tara:strand:- start:1402 stop:2067 length:666 start_codon:yes stop_codon:yes gene_type:complete
MAQNTLVIDNQAANPARLDIEAAIQAVATNNSGATEPATPYENMWWYETDTNILKIRNEANNAWLNVAYLNQGGTFEVLDDTRVVNTSGTQTGLLGDQITSTWEAGTGTTESLVSPVKVKAAIDAFSLSETARDVTGNAGYLKLSNGFIFQWDRWSFSHGSRNFPITFPNACLGFGYTQYSGWYENWNGYPTSTSAYYTSNIMVGTNASRANYQNMFSIGY